MSEPRQWTMAQLESDVDVATQSFRQRRLDEPLELYSRFFDRFAPLFDTLVDRVSALVDGSLDPAEMGKLAGNADAWTAFRYLAAPPISEDDLKTLARTSVSAAALRGDAERARRVRDTVAHVVDPHRFPWIRERRAPTERERAGAVVASAVLVAARKVETLRRSDAKKRQEEAVKATLRAAGFRQVPPRDMPMLDAAPAPGEFCGESKLGDSRADVVVRLHDRRAMPVECKVSNSAVNSYKRINHEAVRKARAWRTGFGSRQIVPAAVLGGVFGPANLAAAQDDGLAIFWSHRLSDLAEFVESTRGGSA